MAPSRAAGEQATAKECSFQRPVAVHAATAKSGGLACCVQSRDRSTIGAKDPSRQIRGQPTQTFPRKRCQSDSNKRSMLGGQHGVRWDDTHQLVGCKAAGLPDGIDLGVFSQSTIHLPVTGRERLMQPGRSDQLGANQCVHLHGKFLRGGGLDKINASVKKLLHGTRGTGECTLGEELDVLAREIGVLLGAGQGKFLADNGLVQHKPGVIVSGGFQMPKGAE